MGEADPPELIGRAVEYGFPVFETARLAYAFAYDPGNPRRVPVNRFSHRRTLTDHRHRLVTTPNHDTLYSSAVLDLSAGPVTLTVPEFGDRYYSVAFLDAYTNAFAYVGTRVTGGHGGVYRIAGPGWLDEAPPGATVIRAPGDHISAHIRILTDGISDYPEVHALQDGCRLTGPLPSRPSLIRPIPADGENFLAVVNQVLREDPPPHADAPVLADLSQVGIGHSDLSARQLQWWRDHFAAARANLIAASKDIGICREGWQYPPPAIGNFGTDYRTRARIAISGIVANIAAESVYAIARTDAAGRPLSDRHRYRFRLAPGTPPVDGFWSLAIYEIAADGGLFFSDNALNRYAVGSRTPGMHREHDEGLVILIQKDQPDTGPDNWLPAPAGNFALVLRAYLPRPVLLDGGFGYAGIERLDAAG